MGKRDHILVSLDIGNGYVKARGPNNISVSYPSLVAEVVENMPGFDFSLNGAGKFVIGYRDHQWAIGDTVRYEGMAVQSVTHRSRISMDFYRVLFASALSEVVRTSGRIKAVISLPPAAYFDKERQKAVISGVYDVQRAAGPGPVKFHYELDANDIRVIPEGLGSVCVLALDEQGKQRGNNYLLTEAVGIVDVGTYTTDLIQLDHLRLVKAGCTSIQTALHQIHERLRTYASSCGVDMLPHETDMILQRGYFLKLGDRVRFDDVVMDWARELATVISGQIRSVWNGGDGVDRIIITGGGAEYVEPFLKLEYPHLRLIEETEPFFANCEGGYRYGLLRERAG